MKYLLLCFLFLFVSCEELMILAKEDRTTDAIRYPGTLKNYTGYTAEGKTILCTIAGRPLPEGMINDEITTDGEPFFDDCYENGNEIVWCTYSLPICVLSNPKDEIVGFNIKGNADSCIPRVNVMCTLEWGPQEQFGQDCESADYTALSCGCHEFLCSGNVNE